MKNSRVVTLVQPVFELGSLIVLESKDVWRLEMYVHSDNKFVFAQEIEIAKKFEVRVDCL